MWCLGIIIKVRIDSVVLINVDCKSGYWQDMWDWPPPINKQKWERTRNKTEDKKAQTLRQDLTCKSWNEKKNHESPETPNRITMRMTIQETHMQRPWARLSLTNWYTHSLTYTDNYTTDLCNSHINMLALGVFIIVHKYGLFTNVASNQLRPNRLSVLS